MKPDDSLCLCFQVSLRKVQQFLVSQRPARASQLSECYGAGTGCGWCRRYLKQLHQQWQDTQREPAPDGFNSGRPQQPPLPDAQTHAAGRAAYRRREASE